MTTMPAQRRPGDVSAGPPSRAADFSHGAVRGILVGLGLAVPLWLLLLCGVILLR